MTSFIPNQNTMLAIEAEYAKGNHRIVCPSCMGGSDHEECMSLWPSENGDLMATCHRAHCNVGTFAVGKWSKADTGPKQKRVGPATLVDRDYKAVSKSMYRWLRNKYTFEFDPRYVRRYMREVDNPHRPGLVLPMENYAGTTKGMVIKPTNADWNGPKSLTYKDDPEYSGMSWFMSHGDVSSPHVFVVEDCLSAIALKQASGCATVSLNGTVLNDDRIRELLQFKWRIILMLDADATRKAISYAQKYGPDVIRVVRLQHDIKDMTVADVESLLEREEL